ncbi:hypothetical protein EJ07DRAFT_160536 [Lizonia empirigonia]|nr:hypothetical protein EJ07DRAFT_160536 [Lizonia empirigonia]
MRLAAAQNEHARFFREVKAIWDELASWEDNLRVTDISFHVTGFSVYKFVGPGICSGEYLDNTLLDFASLPVLPLLPYISAALFWNSDAELAAGSREVRWPNLRILDISTSLERPSGDYWLRPPTNYPKQGVFHGTNSKDLDLESDDEDTERYQAGLLGPDARSSHQGGFLPTFHQYEGWTFYYRASNDARFASRYPKLYFFKHEPGLDRTDIERPRTEWVFQCPHAHLQWEEPEAAKAVWREKCPRIDFDVLALDVDGMSWERRRNGNLVPLLGEKFATKFLGRYDLDEIPRGLN